MQQRVGVPVFRHFFVGGPSWQFKRVAVDSSKPWFTQDWKGKMAAGFTNSGPMNGDKRSAVHYLFTLSQQHSMIWVGMGLLPANLESSTRDDVNHLGPPCGLMTLPPADASAEEMATGNIATATAFGKRVKTAVDRSAA